MVERKVGHSALKWNKDKQELETFDPNPAKEGEMEKVKEARMPIDINKRFNDVICHLELHKSGKTSDHGDCFLCQLLVDVKRWQAELTRLRTELAEKEAEKNEYKKCFEAELEGNNYYCKKYAKEHETFREFLGRIFSEKEEAEAALATERERVLQWQTEFFAAEVLRKQLEAEANELLAQLPDGMKHCTILFKECEKGHGWLTATNWIQHDCLVCEVNELRERLKPIEELLERFAGYSQCQLDRFKSGHAYLDLTGYTFLIEEWQAIKQAGEKKKINNSTKKTYSTARPLGRLE